MPDPPASETESDFVCDCEEWMRSACAREAFFREHGGKRYCVLHFPENEKSAEFEKTLQRKLGNKDFIFRGVWFPDNRSFSGLVFGTVADFRCATFNGHTSFNESHFAVAADFRSVIFNANASFRSALFSADANFRSATFGGFTSFRSAIFNKEANFSLGSFKGGAASFSAATFRGAANFRSANFLGVAFRSATFCAAANFHAAIFKAKTDFNSTSFADRLVFTRGEESSGFNEASSLDLQFARVEKPELVLFHSLRLDSNWFVNVDSRKFDFANVKWNRESIRKEIRKLKSNKVSTPHSVLAIACQCLATNAENNNRYAEASTFRYMAMDAQRMEKSNGVVPWRVSWWYWLASGYGERVLQAFLVSLAIWLLAGMLYTQVGFARWEPSLASENDVATAKWDEVGAPLPLKRALSYSAGVMTLQRPEPKPATAAAQIVVLLETVFGPLQAALLALAIRRKFMR